MLWRTHDRVVAMTHATPPLNFAVLAELLHVPKADWLQVSDLPVGMIGQGP